MNRTILLITSFLIGVVSAFAQAAFNTPGAGNPVIPGYFADPTIKKFGDTYYMYATTDGSGAGFGPAQVWTSKDFVNWTLMPMNWPDSHWIWAPDVMQHSDGKYYYFYCQPCIIHCGVSETPRGPWKNILGDSEAVLIPDRFVTNAITLDGQTFVDDDGSVYMYWGTWGPPSAPMSSGAARSASYAATLRAARTANASYAICRLTPMSKPATASFPAASAACTRAGLSSARSPRSRATPTTTRRPPWCVPPPTLPGSAA